MKTSSEKSLHLTPDARIWVDEEGGVLAAVRADGSLATPAVGLHGRVIMQGAKLLYLGPNGAVALDEDGVMGARNSSSESPGQPAGLARSNGQVYLTGAVDGDPLWRQLTAFGRDWPADAAGSVMRGPGDLKIAPVQLASPNGSGARLSFYGSGRIADEDQALEVFLQFGDSESCGTTSITGDSSDARALVDYATFPGRVLMAGPAIRVHEDVPQGLEALRSAVDARESSEIRGVDVFGDTGAAASGALLHHLGLDQSSSVLVNSLGAPGAVIADWRKGGELYGRLRSYLNCAADLAERRNLAPRWRFSSLAIGYNDMMAGVAANAFAAEMEQLACDLAEDSSAIFGSATSPTFILQQMCPYVGPFPHHPGWSPVAEAILELGLHHERFRLAGPVYPYPFTSDGAHARPESYVHWFAKAAEAAAFELQQRKRWRPLHASRALVQPDGSVEVRMESPYGLPLIFDSRQVSDPALGAGGGSPDTPYGFGLVDADGAFMAIHMPTVGPDARSVILRPCSGRAVSGCSVEIACTWGFPQGPQTGMRSSLRDISEIACVATGRPMPNWACHQVVHVQ